jgi:hypothetical protein
MGENQTRDQALADVKPTDKGSGVFAIPNPTNGPGVFTKVIVNNITYRDCIQRGRLCIAFKWVPKKLVSHKTRCPTPNMLCVGSCVHDTCLCIDGACQ